MFRRRFPSLPAVILIVTAGSVLAEDAAPPDPWAVLEELRTASLDTPQPRRLQKVRLDTGFAVLELADGVLFPARAVSGQVVEMVFIGRGVVHFEPPDAIEAGQLELFTGSRVLAESFTEAVFVVGRDDAARSLVDRPVASGVDPRTSRLAGQRFARWRKSPERALMGVDAGLLSDALGDPLYEDFFAASFRGEKLGEFLLLIDPAAEEQIRMGQFVPFEATARQQRRISRFLGREQQRGRLTGLEVADLGVWDTWISAPRHAGGRPVPGLPAFEPRHYTLDVTVQPRSEMLLGSAGIELVATTGGRRVVHLSLHRDLEITRIVDDEGRDLPFLREGAEIHAVLPEALPQGTAVKIEVVYSGKFLDRGQDRNWALRDALAWYPHAGAIDRATYDVILRRPPKFDLLASGAWLASGGEGKLRWDHRRLDVPAIGFSFEVGRFEIHKAQAGHVAVTVAFDPSLVKISGQSLSDITSAVTDSLLYYEQLFGAYPLDEIVVVTVPRNYSQAMLGFVTLANAMMLDWGMFGDLLGVTDRRAVVAHEIAHQWWGHQVGWRGYRDRWISEAMANYASLSWSRHRLGQLGAASLTHGWQEELTATLADGRPLESAGPLVLGYRLDSSRSVDAYEAIVYRKGALVLGMLASTFSEELFDQMLREIVERSRGQVLSTGDFLALLEEMAGVDLDAFARQFIYGTGLPEIFYTYQFEETEAGRWRVRIMARQESPHHFRYLVVERAGGGFDVARRRLDRQGIDGVSLLVPFQVNFSGSALGVGGYMEISDGHGELSFEIDRRPEDVWLDTRREVFGRFFNERRHPKRMLLYQGFDSAAVGAETEAETFFRRALTTATPSVPGGSSSLSQLQAVADRLLNAQIHLELARLKIAGDRDDEARRSLMAAAAALERSERSWIADDVSLIEARLDIRRRDYSKAFRRLRKNVLKQRRLDSAESYLLLAIAARETGNRRELEEAVATARKKGADVSRLLRAD